MPSVVSIVYCGAWGYGSKFRAIQSAILSQYVFNELDFPLHFAHHLSLCVYE